LRGRYPKLVGGDVNGFLGLVVDNLSVLALLAALLIGTFKIPADVVFGRMFPGTTLGVCAGDLFYAWLAVRLARRSGRTDVTAMPFGLDTPSSIGMALLVLGPAFSRYRGQGLSPTEAGIATWHLGMAATLTMGAVKLVLAFAGRRVQRLVPQAGLLGSLAGIALMLIGFLPLVELMKEPVAGIVTLGLVLYALAARGDIPLRMPGVLFAVLVGLLIYYGLGALHVVGLRVEWPGAPTLRLALPHSDLGVLAGFRDLPEYLPLIVPFALLTVIGGVNNTESAKAAGDDYDVRNILWGEAAATLIAGLAGGIAQTTPYIGHPAYKKMGARTGYVVLTGLFIGVGGLLGFVSNLIELIPIAVLAPVMVFISMGITVQAFQAVPARHAAAVAFCFFPSIARMLTIELSKPEFVPGERLSELMLPAAHSSLPAIVVLGNGFIVTATLWGAFVVELIDKRLRAAAAYLAAASVLCLFGIIHSVRLDGSAYALWRLRGHELELASQLSLAYLTLAVALLVLSWKRNRYEARSP
jgi:AGZA family xanthine/uracil permease-like MFS transporter